jgi:predicted AlkP superfamily phosphohydrolase/phosphomutase
MLVLAGLVGTLGSAVRAEPAVVIVGLDGYDPNVVEDLWSQGDLPNLAALAEHGVYSRLTTYYGSRSPVVWTTVATGHTPEVHGIDDFVAQDGTGQQVSTNSDHRRVRALWNILTERDRSTLVFNWWASWPAESLQGLEITDRVHADDIERRVWPEERMEEIEGWIAQADQAFGEKFPRDDLAGGPARLAAWAAPDLVSSGEYDLSMIYLRTVDPTAHRYWKFYQPEHYAHVTEEDIARYRPVLLDAYRAVDEVVGSIVQAAPPDAHVIVMSDHGFKHVEERNKVRLDLDHVFQELGYQQRLEDGSIDWEQTRVYVHATPLGRQVKQVRVNLQGREDQGVVPESGRKMVLDALQAELATMTYFGSEVPAFSFSAPRKSDTGDLLVEVLSEGAHRKLVYREQVIEQAVLGVGMLTGGHGNDTPGVFFMVGPGVQAGAKLDEPDILDVAPTLLHLLGLPVGEDMEGHVLAEGLTEAWSTEHPVRTLPTYETSPFRVAAVETPTGSEATTVSEEDILEELRSLGYIE